MREAAPFLTLVSLALEQHPPSAAVTDLAVSAHAVPHRPGQGGLWHPPAPALRVLATVLARLARLAGTENVGAARPGDTHRPDAFTLGPFRPGPAGPGSPAVAAGGEGGALALRRVRPPRPLAVEVADGHPVRVFWSAQQGTSVLGQAGPWRVSGDWWDSGAWARDEWDVALADGTLCRLAQDLVSGTWLLDAIYD
jgi:protein ImuB